MDRKLATRSIDAWRAFREYTSVQRVVTTSCGARTTSRGRAGPRRDPAGAPIGVKVRFRMSEEEVYEYYHKIHCHREVAPMRNLE